MVFSAPASATAKISFYYSFVDIAHTYSFFTIKFDIEELISSPNEFNLFGGAADGAEILASKVMMLYFLQTIVAVLVILGRFAI